jgi:DNA-binding NarL/FixJ family response regulator
MNGLGPETGRKISVAIIDDHRLLAESIAAGLGGAEDIEVIGTASTGSDGLRLVRLKRPDVCLLDQRLPDALGTDLVPTLVEASPATRVLLVTASESDGVLRRALEVGCVGFLTKGESIATLIDAVRRAAAGEVVLTPDDLRRLLPPARAGAMRLGQDLSPREREVLALLREGRTTAAISADLYLAPSTVRNHVQSILTKLGAHSKLEAVTIALREGILESE